MRWQSSNRELCLLQKIDRGGNCIANMSPQLRYAMAVMTAARAEPFAPALFREVFLGELGPAEALDWGGDPDVGNVPRRIGAIFPRGTASDPFDVFAEWYAQGRFTGRRVDWGACAAVVTPRDVHAFLVACYGRDGIPPAIVQTVAALDPDRRYALVASAG